MNVAYPTLLGHSASHSKRLFLPHSGRSPAPQGSAQEGGKRLFDHLVGAGEDQGREGKTQSFRGLHIDDQLELGRADEGQIGRLFALEYPARVDGC